MSESILRLPEVQTRTGLSRSSIYEKLSQNPPQFPEPISLGKRAIGFVESEINEWIAERISQSRNAA